MKMLIAIVAICASSPAFALPSTIKPGDRFTVAAAKLREAGWLPDPQAHAFAGEYFGTDRELVRRGYPEVDFCSVDTAHCVYQYVKGSGCLRLKTLGEQIERMRVVGVSNQCRDKGSDDSVVLPGDVRLLMQWQMECDRFDNCEGLPAYHTRLTRKYARDQRIRGFIQDIAPEPARK
jgi:hypothetical protein